MISMQLEQAAEAINGQLSGDNLAFTGCTTDTRHIDAGQLFLALKGERFNAHEFLQDAKDAGAVAVVIDEDTEVDIPFIKVENTRTALGKLAQAWRRCQSVPVVAITGSNGKTTVKEMVSAILSVDANVMATRGNYNNDIGVPLTLFRLDDTHDYGVVEMGANHEGEIAVLTRLAEPQVALITQCAPAHLEGFGSIEGVSRAKGEIFEGLDNEIFNTKGTAIINADDVYADYWSSLNAERPILYFGFSDRADVTARVSANTDNNSNTFQLIFRDESISIDLPLPGRHNIMNALAAAACVLALNIPLQQIRDGLQSMQGVAGRLQIKHGKDGMTIIDDTYNANPTSLTAALQVLAARKGQKWLALGDMGELGDEAEIIHAEMGSKARDMGVDKIFTLGQLSLAASQSFGLNAEHFSSHESLTDALCRQASSDITLLVKGSRSIHMEKIVNALMSAENSPC